MATSTLEKREGKKLSREQIRQLSEIERQKYYTDRLDDETYDYPLFSGKQAVLSQRRSGYPSYILAAFHLDEYPFHPVDWNEWRDHVRFLFSAI